MNSLLYRNRNEERTGFQEFAPYHPTYDLQTDFVMVYGIDSTMPERVRQWREKGYVVHLMTGVSWGEYQDYLYGVFDGEGHWDEAQKKSSGELYLHNVDSPYMVPTISFTEFLTERIKAAIDAGVEAIHLEEPEFWVVSGYSDAFKREWEIFYKEPWTPLYKSVDSQYKGSRLKSYLYTRCLDQLCTTLKSYAITKYNRLLRFYVPTHSLINYSQWRIISPESRLLNIPTIDGYIAQIWTGTSRTPNVYEGVRKERTFETSFLEYGIMQELIRGTNRCMWFLHDPIEDNPEHTWQDYRDNYFKTVTAALLHPVIYNFEICPWPHRVFNGSYPTSDGKGKETVPPGYATTLLTIMNTLADMKHEDVYWEQNNCTIGLLLADSCMFQRELPISLANLKTGNELKNALADWSAFYGLALPILKHGMPVRPLQLDNIIRNPGYLDDYRVLVLSYEFMKPEFPGMHNEIAQWVRNGGVLVYVGDGSDPFHNVQEWWNKGKKKYMSPAGHLFETLGVGTSPDEGIFNIGRGVFGYLHVNPSDIAYQKKQAERYREFIKTAMEARNDPGIVWSSKNSYIMHRGPYIIATVLDESVNNQQAVLKGRFVKLFDPELPLTCEINLKPGENTLLYDLDRIPEDEEVWLIAAASRIEDFKLDKKGFSFTAKGPEGVKAVARFYSKRKITSAGGTHGEKKIPVEFTWDDKSSTVLLSYPNIADGIRVTIQRL